VADTTTLAKIQFATKQKRRSRLAAVPVAGWVFITIVLVCVIGPFLTPYGPNQLAVGIPFEGPSLAHPMGVDDLGRDMLSRVMSGGLISLSVGIAATLISMVVALPWGLIAAARGGWVDTALMRLGDSVMAIPQILFALVCVAAFRPSVTSMTIIIGLLLAPTTARMVRSTAVAELASDYATAARASGVGMGRLLAVEVLPNIAPPLLVQASLNIAEAIMLEATLSFLGMGIQPPEASWGTLLLQGYSKLFNSTTLVIFPALAIIITVASLTLLSDRLGKTLDRTKGIS